ncbi:MAG: hypothetical protein V1734_04445 [Nanoarchaeota archaeon]
MYHDFETKTSFRYLKEVISSLNEPVCILGGWAVFFHANGNFEKAQGRPYLGSRDIDLGFHIDKNTSDAHLGKIALAQAIKILTEKLKFRPLSFRLFKEVHTETEEEVEEGKIIPAHFIFPMYVDPIVDNIPKNFRKVFGFAPVDEPLLNYAFSGKDYITRIKVFNRNLLLPSPALLLAMKVNSLPNRDKEHKRIKDICDIFALLWYANAGKLQGLADKAQIKKCLSSVTKEDLGSAGERIGHTSGEVERVLNTLKER